MGDYLYYVTSTNRVAKRDFKTQAELERMISNLPDGEDDHELEDQLAAAKARAGKGINTAFKGVRFARSFVSSITSKVNGLLDSLADLPDGATQREADRLAKEEDLKRFWLAEQEELGRRFKAQEHGDKLKAEEKSKLAAIARKAAIAGVRAGVKEVIARRKKKKTADS
jgi:hypothetical protein